MLTFFPGPYPDEWWYSVICRYCVRNGTPSSMLFLQKFYEDFACMSLGTLFPGRDCYSVIRQIPDDIFPLREILLEHTLLPYYLRFYPLEEKEKILEEYLAGEEYKMQNIKTHTLDNKQGIKFCPVCYAQDIAQYGEPYWHREHQIPLVSICPKHACQLYFVEISISRLKRKLVPLCQIPNTENTAPSPAYQNQEVFLSSFAFSVLTLPFETAPQKYNRLKETLQSSEFASSDVHGNPVLDAKRLCQRCIAFYGKAEYGRYWSDVTSCGLARICSWSSSISPELYILLSVLLGLTAEDLFSPRKDVAVSNPDLVLYDSPKETRLTDETTKPPAVRNQRAVKRKPGKSCPKKDRSEKTDGFVLFLTDEEWDTLITAASICGNKEPASFARTALLQETKQIIRDKIEGETER